MDPNNFIYSYTNNFQFIQKRRRSSLIALFPLILLFLLACHGLNIICFQVPLTARYPPEPASLSPKDVPGESKVWPSSSTKLSSTVLYSVKEQDHPFMPKSHLRILQKSPKLSIPTTKRRRKRKPTLQFLHSGAPRNLFSTRTKEFLGVNSCEIRIFMTWISSINSFGERELLVIESLFKSHPKGCLIIVSSSMDSRRGRGILRPFLNKGFHVTAISPDFNYLFKQTPAETWYNRLKKGDVDPGEVSLGQNLSNLLRLALLYKFGGVYIDTDVVVLKSLVKLKNVIGAQAIDSETGNWSRLNNAVMIFDKYHPLLYKFIEEFALTFDGNKWGHNGPYLVSRVVSRVQGRPGFDFEVMPPMAFYPVNWSRIHGLFSGPRNETHSRWLRRKLGHIQGKSYAVHLWNRQSRMIKIEEGSIISQIMSNCCVFCHSSASEKQIGQR
ncbi:hypothetical protein NMG60_11012675 [Bertholletia excelsa]